MRLQCTSMTSYPRKTFDLHLLFFSSLSHSLTRSHTQMFIHEHSSSSKDGLHVRLASERQRAIEASHGDINLINMMK